MIHYAQIIKTGSFKQFDYGNDKENTEHYGSVYIPELNLDNISTSLPIALFSGNQDQTADPHDVAWLADRLGERIIKSVKIDKFDHQSFSIGKNMTYVNDVLHLLDQYSSPSPNIYR